MRTDPLKKISRAFGLAAMALGVLLLAGCPSKIPPLIQQFPEDPELNAEKVSGIIDQRAASFQSLQGLGKVHIKNWEEQYKFSEVFAFSTPSKFRLETLGFLDQPVVFFISDGSMLSLFSKKHNTLYRGVASQKNLFQLSGINLSVEDMLLVFSGNPPRLPNINSEWGLPLPDRNQFYLERISLPRNTLQRIVFNTQTHTISGIREYMLSNGELTLNIVFDNYRALEGAYPIPEIIQIERPFDNVRVDIRYSDWQVNHAIDEQDLFSFPPPPQAKLHILDALESDIEPLDPFDEFRVKGEKE
ncbi:hypothetical protein CSB45_09805 [candidate division KSB3 bacterium]|uniref:DUF4292 domain-containing protein n=1 Tax=candidate division KSB3 bacterium TaxID=2044937 RepID=A0A2G6E3V2_9BACT|nr:MAG: hypothetical protein CSB45_09805 [candidate division KSB3 bacterium]PIE29385.1 MAG: hypothetical protein CSA57_09290 [candidate division KSB3 bacterium]